MNNKLIYYGLYTIYLVLFDKISKKKSLINTVFVLVTIFVNSCSTIDSYEQSHLEYILEEDATEYDRVNTSRENNLRQAYANMVETEGYEGKWYGVQWTEERNPENVIAINSPGGEYLHSELPIQNRMRRCVTKDNIVKYYLDSNNSELKADGTPAILDGTDGNVMVEVPEFFFRIEEEKVGSSRVIRIKISEDAMPGFVFSPKRYTSAYEATINRVSGTLSSVCTTLFLRNDTEEVKTKKNNYVQGTAVSRGVQKTARRRGHTDNAALFRGGTNDATLDQYENPSDVNYSRNQLGLPAANLNRQQIRAATGEHQFGYLYDTQKALFMLIQVEYKTRQIQKPIAFGGLGPGATVYPSYAAYESFFKPQRGISVLPCGITNALGNNSGEVYYLMENVPISFGTNGNDSSYSFANVWMPCMSYRGVEHYYGHIYKIVDQVECVTGPTTGYLSGHDGDVYYSLHSVQYWYEKNPYSAKLGIRKEENLLGTWNFACHITTVSSLLMGESGHILPIGTDGKDYAMNYCDGCEIDAFPGKSKYITFNGRIVSGQLVGNLFVVSVNTTDGGDARPSDGTRLDHF